MQPSHRNGWIGCCRVPAAMPMHLLTTGRLFLTKAASSWTVPWNTVVSYDLEVLEKRIIDPDAIWIFFPRCFWLLRAIKCWYVFELYEHLKLDSEMSCHLFEESVLIFQFLNNKMLKCVKQNFIIQKLKNKHTFLKKHANWES